MKPVKRPLPKPPDFFAALIRTAYFPIELPPAITTKYFSEFCKNRYSELKAEQKKLVTGTTNFETFTAPRTVSGRRNLALVHPLAQAGLSLLITQNRTKLKDLINQTGTSLYRTEPDIARSRAFAGLDFRAWETLKAKLYSECPFILQADISRFFYTAYTHSIPWAIIGKAKVKNWLATKNKRKLDAHWSNEFDVALQSCRSRETFGIPVGPDTSRLIAEMLLAGIEKDEALQPFLKNQFAFRLVDDFIIGFEEEETAKKALAALRSALWKFNLQLNEDKTAIFPSRALYRARWEFDHAGVSISDGNTVEQEHDVYRLVELTLHYCFESKSDTPAIWASRKLGALKTIDRNILVILDALFRLAREFPRCISHVASFLINNQSGFQQNARERITKWARWMLKVHLPHGHDFEIAWCLVICGVLKIQIRRQDVLSDKLMPNAVIFTLLGLLHEKGLLKTPLSNWPWRAHLKKSGVYSENWLPFYESVRRKWTTDKKMISAVTGDVILSKMLADKVTFLEDDILQAAKISLTKRVFKKGRRQNIRPTQWRFGNIPIPQTDYE